jgi:hypothetical protein
MEDVATPLLAENDSHPLSGSVSESAPFSSLDGSSETAATSVSADNEPSPPAQAETSFHLSQVKTGDQTRNALFTPMPYYHGDEHGGAWSKLHRKNGERLLPTLNECGLMVSDLALPTTIQYSDPTLAPQSDDEWLELFQQSFEDLSDTCTDPGKAQEAFARRAELERTYFKGDGIKQFLRPRYREKDKNVEVRFQFRYATTHFGLATRVVSNTTVEEIYGRIADESKKRDFRATDKQLVERIDKTTTAKVTSSLVVNLS